MLDFADGKIDGPLRARLLDGSIRLLRCAWLMDPLSDASLGRYTSSSGSGAAPVMHRRQDLLDAAFFTPQQAVPHVQDRSPPH